MSDLVLISYSRQDRNRAHRICEYLEKEGIACWIAPRNIPTGMNWGEAIIEAIDKVKVILVIVSKETFGSKHVQREVERADSKDKIIVPIYCEEVKVKGSLEYYFGTIQHLAAYPGSIDEHLPKIAHALKPVFISLSESFPSKKEARNQYISDDDLVALGRSICWDIREELNAAIGEEDNETIAEPKPGQLIKFIDLACNKRARRAIARWENIHGRKVHLTGEDIAPVALPPNSSEVICCLDSIDGTQHWLGRRNLYCTAISFFVRDKYDSSVPS